MKNPPKPESSTTIPSRTDDDKPRIVNTRDYATLRLAVDGSTVEIRDDAMGWMGERIAHGDLDPAVALCRGFLLRLGSDATQESRRQAVERAIKCYNLTFLKLWY